MKEAFPGRCQAEGAGAEQPAIWGTTQDHTSFPSVIGLMSLTSRNLPQAMNSKDTGLNGSHQEQSSQPFISGHLSGCIIVLWGQSIINLSQATNITESWASARKCQYQLATNRNEPQHLGNPPGSPASIPTILHQCWFIQHRETVICCPWRRHPNGLRQLSKPLRRNKLDSHPSNLKDVFTKASGLSNCGNSSARISSGGRVSWTIVGRGFSLTFPVSPSMREFHRQFCDLDPKDERKMYKWITANVSFIPSQDIWRQSRTFRHLSSPSISQASIRYLVAKSWIFLFIQKQAITRYTEL